MFARRTDLPLDHDALSRFLPWLIAFMVYLAVMAMAGVLLLDTLSARWDQGISDTLTVQIPPSGEGGDDSRRMEGALELLRGMPEVKRAEAIAHERIVKLLEPWLGKTGVTEDLPLPGLVDVELKSGASVDLDVLSRRLQAVAVGATVDDHGVWLNRLVRLIRSVEILALLVLLLIAAATVGTVIFTTRTGLAIHQEAIEVLHLIGAHDSYIARQFASRALNLGVKGGLLGLALAVPTLLGIGALAARMESGLLPELTLTWTDWAALAALPLAVAVIAMATARYTVTRTLTRMP